MPSGPSQPLDERLVEHVERGEVLDLAGDDPVDEQAVRAWGEDRTVSAVVLRDIVRGRAAADADPRGLRLRGARIRGHLDLAFITSSVPVALNDCLFEEGLNAVDARLPQLDLEGCVIERSNGIPLNAAGLTATLLTVRNATISSVDAFDAMTVEGADLGDLDCLGATIRSDSGIAMAGDDLRVHRKAILGGGFTATSSASRHGTVTLNSAELGELMGIKATIRNEDGPALHAESLHVHRDVLLSGDFSASHELSTIDLDGAELGDLDCADSTMLNTSGPTLSMDNARVRRDMTVRRCTMTAPAPGAAVSLTGTHVGDLTLAEVTVDNPIGTAVDAADLRTDRDFSISGTLSAGGDHGYALDLERSKVNGELVLYRAVLRHRFTRSRRLVLDGLTYSALPLGFSYKGWLTMLRDATDYYSAQPYQQLAAVHRAAGHDSEARRVLMAQRRDQLDRRTLTGRAERAWVRLTGLTLGYGYQPWRALIGLLLVIGAAVTLAVVLGGRGGLAQVADPALPCTVVERVGVGLDLGTPLISTRTRCDITNTADGQALTITGWVLRLLAWAFATLFIAGFTSAVRKT